MHRAVRIELFQQMPNYRKPSSFLIRETYPLPPYSSVIGMIHNVCGFKEYHPMKISIQGETASTLSDYAVMYMFNPESAPKDRLDNGFLAKGNNNIKDTLIYRSPKSVEFLTDVNLLIHIISENDDELEFIAERFRNPPEYISLGRREDIVRVDSINIVELQEEVSEDDITLKNDAYVPSEYLKDFEGSEEIKGTIYKLPKVFDTSDKSGIRNWKEVIPARHMPAFKMIEIDIFDNENVMYDKEKDTPVFFA